MTRCEDRFRQAGENSLSLPPGADGAAAEDSVLARACREQAVQHALLRRAIRGGELPATADANALAGPTMAVIQEMSALVREGAKRKKLLRLADTAMWAWAEPVKKPASRTVVSPPGKSGTVVAIGTSS